MGIKSINDVPADIYHILDSSTDHQVSEENLEAFAAATKDLLRSRLRSATPRGDPLRFSALGRPDRQLWYAARSKGESFSPKHHLKFLYGDIIEQLLLFLVKESGHEVANEQLELEVSGVKGHIDAVIDGVTTDVKSASPMSYAKFANGSLYENDPFGYIGQISSYASVLTPETGGAFLAFDKVHGDICVLNVGPSITNAFSVPKRIDHLRDVIASDTAPKRCYSDEPDGKSGNRRLCTQCSYCSFKNDCWPNLRTFLYSGKPRFLTEVVRTPDVYEVVKPDA